MLSLYVQPGVQGSLTCPSFPTPKLSKSFPLKHQAMCMHSSTIFVLKSRPIRRTGSLSTSATAEAVITETDTDNSPSDIPSEEAEIEKVAVKPVEKPRLVLKFIWMEKNIGLALDQTIPGHGPTPLSPYYFWPRKDAWEELKTTLENKPWVSQKKMILLLNQATDIINLWQQSGGNLSG